MSEEETTSEFVEHCPCDECGSSDANGLYSDGHTHCFSCGAWVPGDDSDGPREKRTKVSSSLVPFGEYKALKARGISEETCRRFKYSVSKYSGKSCHVAAYEDQEGNIAAQHIRLAGKKFPWVGETKGLKLFGQGAARDGATKVIITEGEVDAMSVYQIINAGKSSRWPCLSVYRGAKGAKKDLATNLSWLEKADEIILMFDNDEPGIEAAKECAKLFKPGKCKIATLPLKDANEMLVAGRSAEVVDAIFAAKEFRPEGIVRLGDMREEIMTDPVLGMPWFLPTLTEVTYGRHLGELDALGAGTGVGKTDFLTQQIVFDLTELALNVGIFFLEQQPQETGRRLAGKLVGRRFHIPSDKLEDDQRWCMDELADGLDKLEQNGNLYMYDHFGVADYDGIEETIRHLHHANGVNIFYVDHLTALAAQEDDERKALEVIMSRLGGLVKELPIYILIISHLATPEGKSHEEGGRVMIKHFKGSRSIGFWCHHMFGMERDQQAEDIEARSTTTFRVLKDRVTGQSTGKTIPLGYYETTGRLYEKAVDDGWDDFADDDDGDPPAA